MRLAFFFPPLRVRRRVLRDARFCGPPGLLVVSSRRPCSQFPTTSQKDFFQASFFPCACLLSVLASLI